MDRETGVPAGNDDIRRRHTEGGGGIQIALACQSLGCLAWRVKARDPEQCIGQWAREGAMLGMDVEVQPSDIFPSVESEESLETRMDLSDLTELRNYESMETQKDEAMVELHRYLEKGFVKILPLEMVHQRFPSGRASRLAMILKQTEGGRLHKEAHRD